MSENTITYEDKLNVLRQEIEELRLANARLEALVDARLAKDDWFESVGTE